MSRPFHELALRLVDVAELLSGECPGGITRHALRDQIANATLEMKRDLLVHVAVGARDPKEPSYAVVFRHARAPKEGASSTLNNASLYDRSRSTSARSCRRPAVVSR